MTSRQVREIRKQKLLLAEKDESASSDESSSSQPSLRKAANPFKESEESSEESESEKDEPEQDEQYILDLTTNPKTKDQSDDNDDLAMLEQMEVIGEKESDVTSANLPRIFHFTLSNFDPVVEMSRISATRRRQQQNYSTLIARKHGWLLQNSDLLQKLEEHKAGVRWVGFDPRREIYFNMIMVENKDGFIRFNFLPNDRYLSTFHILEEIISRGDINSLYSFVLPSANPFHPSANYFLAESHMQQDQFETSYKFILQGISSFQCGLHHAWNPSVLQRNTLGDALPSVLLDDLDAGSVASALAIIADDLLVDWNLTQQTATEISAIELRRTTRQRKTEVEEALKTPALGNLLFIKLLLLYATSLLQRGCPRTSLEVLRLINVMTCGRDIAHSLLFIPDAAVRSRQLNMLLAYCDSYLMLLNPCIHYVQNQAVMSGLNKLIQDLGIHQFPFISRLDLFLPHFAFSLPLFLARKVSPREVLERSIELRVLSATDFWSFLGDTLKAHLSIRDVTDSMQPFRDMPTSSQQEVETYQDKESLYSHLTLLRALYLFPAFPTALCQYLDTPSRNLLDEFLRTSKFFKKDLQYNKVFETYGSASASSSSSANALISFIQQGRSDLVTSYAKQSSELWAPLLPWIKEACTVLENIIILERAAEPVQIDQHIYTPEMIKPVLALAPYVHLPGVMVQYAGVRASEFDGKNPTLPDMLLNSAPECVETAPAIARRQDSAALQGLQRWWRHFRDRTGAMNPNSNAVFLFVQALLPWSRIDFTGRM